MQRWSACCSRLQMPGMLATAGTPCRSSAACYKTTRRCVLSGTPTNLPS